MKNLFKIPLILALSVGLFVSCEKENFQDTSLNESVTITSKNKTTNEKSSVNRSDFDGLYINQQKEIYDSLGFADKKSLWLDKLNQIKGEPIPSQHIGIIDSIIIEVNSSSNISDLSSNNQLQTLALDLLEITSVEDFKSMFSDLNDYSPIDIDSELGKGDFVDDLESDFGQNFVPGPPTPPGLKNCNCNWTCGDGPHGTTSNCKRTSSGCGFLWAHPCEERDRLIP